MEANITLIIVSIFCLCCVSVLIRGVGLERLSIIDIFLVFGALFFFATAIISALLRDLKEYHSTVIVLSQLNVLASLALVWVSSKVLRINRLRALKLNEIFHVAKHIGSGALVIAVTLILAIRLYGFVAYGIISHVDQLHLEFSGKELSYVFSSLTEFSNPVLFAVLIAATAKLWSSSGTARLVQLLLVVIVAILMISFGRRMVAYVLAILVLALLFHASLRLKTAGKLVGLALIIGMLVLFSNFYQSYREYLYWGYLSQTSDEKQRTSVIGEAFNLNATLENLAERDQVWDFHYRILNEQVRGGFDHVPFGSITFQALANSVPRLLNPEKQKQVYQLDAMVADLYGFEVTDYSGSTNAFLIADFGFLGIFIFVVLTIIAVIVGIMITEMLHFAPLLRLVGISMLFFYLINIENELTDYFLLYRNLAILFCLGMVWAGFRWFIGRAKHTMHTSI